jgi:nucleotide-binding universal stress UspA family protein
MPKKILAPLDGTPAAEAGLTWAKHLAARWGVSLHLLTVLEGRRAAGAAPAQRYLKRHKGSIESEGLTVSVEVASGPAAEVIVAKAAEAELTVMTYGTSRWLFGQALDLVLRHAPRPVVVVRAPAAGSRPWRDVSKILVPLDATPESRHSLPAALELARELGASVLLCHVVRPIGIYTDPGQAPPGVARALDGCLEEARRFLGRAALEAQGAGVRAEVTATIGEPFEGIVRLAEDSGAGLIAMATRGNGSLSRVLGSVAYPVAQHGRVPCLLVRRPSAD